MSIELDQQVIDDIDEALNDAEMPNRFRRKLLALKMRHSGVPLKMISRRALESLSDQFRISSRNIVRAVWKELSKTAHTVQ